jgi:tight adherence protein C
MSDMMLAVASTFVVVMAAVVYLGLGVARARKAATERLAVYGSAALREETLSKPMSERFFAPAVLGLGRAVGRYTPVGWLKKTDHKLVLAGNPLNLDANAFAVIKVMAGGAALILFFLVQGVLPGFQKVLVFFLLVVAGFFGPDVMLSRKVDERRDAMRRQLPDVLDLLVISVEAGLGFDAALARVVDTVPGPLSEEFFRMLQETRVGISRREAMRHLEDRTDVDELRSFLLAMMQAEAFGVSIARVLRVQAEEMRIKRRQRAQEKAFSAPVKMVFPLVFCIFPSLFIVLLGPAAISIYRTFSGI